MAGLSSDHDHPCYDAIWKVFGAWSVHSVLGSSDLHGGLLMKFMSLRQVCKQCLCLGVLFALLFSCFDTLARSANIRRSGVRVEDLRMSRYVLKMMRSGVFPTENESLIKPLDWIKILLEVSGIHCHPKKMASMEPLEELDDHVLSLIISPLSPADALTLVVCSRRLKRLALDRQYWSAHPLDRLNHFVVVARSPANTNAQSRNCHLAVKFTELAKEISNQILEQEKVFQNDEAMVARVNWFASECARKSRVLALPESLVWNPSSMSGAQSLDPRGIPNNHDSHWWCDIGTFVARVAGMHCLGEAEDFISHCLGEELSMLHSGSLFEHGGTNLLRGTTTVIALVASILYESAEMPFGDAATSVRGAVAEPYSRVRSLARSPPESLHSAVDALHKVWGTSVHIGVEKWELGQLGGVFGNAFRGRDEKESKKVLASGLTGFLLSVWKTRLSTKNSGGNDMVTNLVHESKRELGFMAFLFGAARGGVPVGMPPPRVTFWVESSI